MKQSKWAWLKTGFIVLIMVTLIAACGQPPAKPADEDAIAPIAAENEGKVEDGQQEEQTDDPGVDGENGEEVAEEEDEELPPLEPYASVIGHDERLVSLHELFEDHFDFGVAINNSQLQSPTDSAIVLKHFNSLTAENHMKIDAMHPQEDLFRWDATDEMLEFAEEHGLKVRGHTLIWHSQVPPWIFVDNEGNDVSREVLLDRMKTHIQTIVGRYKGRVHSWDVLNEIFEPNDGRPDGLRKSKWLEIIGPDYIDYALIWAHEADPDAKLIINDYNTHEFAKRQRMYELAVDLLDRGIPLHGIGHQMHVNIRGPANILIEQTISQFAELGLMNYITELDVNIYENSDGRFTEKPEGLLRLQGERYKEIFDIFLKYSDHIESVTVWGLSDDKSWLRQFPVVRQNWPLIFDETRRTKPAYWALVELMEEYQ